MLLATAEANYHEAYWDAVAASELWLSIPLDRGREDLNRDSLPPIERVGRSEGGARHDPAGHGELLDHNNLPADLSSEANRSIANDHPNTGWNG